METTETTQSVTIRVTRKNGETNVMTSKGVEWKFGGTMTTETVIAALVFQTIHSRFEHINNYSEDFEIEFTINEKINESV